MKKYLKTLASVLMLALVVTMFVPVQSADATSSYDISQNGIYSNKIVVDIPASAYPSIATKISRTYVEVKVGSNSQIVFDQPGSYSQITITGVSPTYSYNVIVYCDYSTSYSSYTGWSVGSIYDAAMAPVKVTGLKQDTWYYSSGSLYTVWNPQEGATGYQYELYNYKNSKVRSGTITSDHRSSVDFTKLASQTHKMRVRAYTDFNGSKRYGAWSDYLNIVPPTKKISTKSSSKKKITVKWNKVKGATSYTIMVSTKRNSGYKATKTVSAKKKKVTINKIGKKKLKSGKYYYVYVRPNKKVNGKNVYSTLKNASWPAYWQRVR